MPPAKFRSRALSRVFGGLLLLWTSAAAGPSLNLGPHPAVRDLTVEVLGGVEYVEAAAFLARHGLTGAPGDTPHRHRFTNTWNTLELETDKREIRFNGRRLFLGDPVLLMEGRLRVARIDAEALLGPLLRPGDYATTRREVRTIVIDAGHGGRDTGTRNARLKLDEKGPALDVALRLGALLEREGLRVIYTRADDTFVSLADRAARANAATPDLFISIHFNAVADAPKVEGTETYVLTPAAQRSTASPRLQPGDSVVQPGNAFDAWNTQLGWHLHHRLLEHLGTFDRGLKRARFAVLRLVECPAVLVEAAYLSNDAEAALIATPEYRQRVAEALATGIAHYAAAVRAAKP